MFQKISNRIKGLFSKPAKSDNSIEIKMKLIELYIRVCISSDIAASKYSADPEHLLKIINNQHIGIEQLLKHLGYTFYRSKAGEEFNPEIQETDSLFVETTEPQLDGKIAKVITPAIKDENGKLINLEQVRLYMNNITK